jgi:hypothetical protein
MEPAGPVKPLWTSATFLQYVGMVVAGGSVLWLLTVLEDEHGAGGLLGWSALALAVFATLAELARRRGEAIVAGLLAVVAVLVFGLLAGSVLDLVGLLPDEESDAAPFGEGIEIGLLLLEALVVTAAGLALAAFRFPLLMLVIGAAVWLFVMDLLEGFFGGGNTGTALLAAVVGVVYVLVASAMDVGAKHPYAMWLHVIAGLSIGGAMLTWWHDEWWEWLLVLAVSLAYVLLARALGRSSWAVLGALGILATATYFVERWFSFGDLVPFFPAETDDVDEWARPLVYVAVGGLFFLLGLLVERRRAAAPPAPPPEIVA